MRDSVPSTGIPPFVMYCVNRKPRSSLLIESTDSMIIAITSAIQRINGASLKEHWAAQRNQVYKQQYQRLQHDTGLRYKIEFFLSSVQS